MLVALSSVTHAGNEYAVFLDTDHPTAKALNLGAGDANTEMLTVLAAQEALREFDGDLEHINYGASFFTVEAI